MHISNLGQKNNNNMSLRHCFYNKVAVRLLILLLTKPKYLSNFLKFLIFSICNIQLVYQPNKKVGSGDQIKLTSDDI